MATKVTPKKKAPTAQSKMRRYRQRLRASGLRPVQIWVPDTRKAGFAEECRKQSLSLRNDPDEKTTLSFLEAASDSEGWK